MIIIIIIILLPIFQFYYNPIKVKSLKGAVVLSENVKLSFKGWFSGDYQKKKEKYLNDNFGFRSDFVRINNQIKYSLFRQVNANGLIIGKNNYLYELNYIKAYYGMDFIGKDSIEHQLSKLKFIQDTLKKLNKNFILIFAAGKASFYPEYIPDEYKKQKSITNYEYMKMMADNKNINIIDFNNYFINNKNKSKYPLYPQYGIHWSNYGMCLVIDSLIKYIENKRGIDIPEFYWNDIEITEKYREPDYD
ncbi:MAG: hypothetical protein Q8880_12400, partial [Bacteroidota bacterium]|nr:hypothetical protein [Bacteroidota bacterium]